MRDAYHKIEFKSNDFIFVHKTGRHFRYDHLNNWLQNDMPIVARKTDIKLHPSNYTAHTLRQGGCIDMARQGVLSWHNEMTGRKYALIKIGEM